MQMRDELGSIYEDKSFADLFPNNGQPAEAPWRLALVTIIQFAEGLSDRQATDAVRGRIDVKYALSLELADPGFDASVLSEFRIRLIAGHAEEHLLTAMLTLFKAWCYVSCQEVQSSERQKRRDREKKKEQALKGYSSFPSGLVSQQWTPSEEKRWIRNATKPVFSDETFFRASYFALPDSLRSTRPCCISFRSYSRTVSYSLQIFIPQIIPSKTSLH